MEENTQFNMGNDSADEVRNLLLTAKKRKEAKMRWKLLAELMDGKTINVTNDPGLYQALNREKMEFEEILKLHPEEVKETIEYVRQRKEEQRKVGNRWYNPDSRAWWGEKGAVPPCCYYARPTSYWQNKKLTNNFFNTFSKFRIADNRL